MKLEVLTTSFAEFRHSSEAAPEGSLTASSANSEPVLAVSSFLAVYKSHLWLKTTTWLLLWQNNVSGCFVKLGLTNCFY